MEQHSMLPMRGKKILYTYGNISFINPFLGNDVRVDLPKKGINQVYKYGRNPGETRFELGNCDLRIKLTGESPKKELILIFSFNHQEFS